MKTVDVSCQKGDGGKTSSEPQETGSFATADSNQMEEETAKPVLAMAKERKDRFWDFAF